jgi:hypothetical protein
MLTVLRYVRKFITDLALDKAINEGRLVYLMR